MQSLKMMMVMMSELSNDVQGITTTDRVHTH